MIHVRDLDERRWDLNYPQEDEDDKASVGRCCFLRTVVVFVSKIHFAIRRRTSDLFCERFQCINGSKLIHFNFWSIKQSTSPSKCVIQKRILWILRQICAKLIRTSTGLRAGLKNTGLNIETNTSMYIKLWWESSTNFKENVPKNPGMIYE